MIIREDRILAAGALLPLAETTIHTERFGTRHRAALGITEQTDAVVVVVSEENGQISLVERARIVRNLNEAQLARAIQGLLDPAGGRRTAWTWRDRESGMGGRSPRIRELGRFVGRSPAAVAATPAAVPNPGPGATTVATTRNTETTSASAAIGQAVNVANPRSADGRTDGAENGTNPGVPMSGGPATDERAVVADPPNARAPEAPNSVAADPADVVTDEPASATTTPTARPTATPARKPEGDPIATAAVRAQR